MLRSLQVTHRIFLIPGFFGFANLGELKYFAHVRDYLNQVFREHDESLSIHYVKTLPTGSLVSRVERLEETIEAAKPRKNDPIHLVGHSSGGLDARLYVETQRTRGKAGRDIATVTTIATPHFGVPQAQFFAGATGQQMLRVLSLFTLVVLRSQKVPLPLFVTLAGAVARGPRMGGPKSGVLHQLDTQLLNRFDKERREEVIEFFTEAASDQSLQSQITFPAMDIFNAGCLPCPGVKYASVVTCSPKPSVKTVKDTGLSPMAQTSHAIYRALHTMASRSPADKLPPLTEQAAGILQSKLGRIPDKRDNDGVVPSLSQVFGTVIHAALADHHDVLGHFDDPKHKPPHIDWLSSLSRFSRSNFEELWLSVAAFCLQNASRRKWFQRKT